MRAISKYKPPPPGGGTYIWRGNLTEGFLHYEFGGLIHGGDYFQDFTVSFFWRGGELAFVGASVVSSGSYYSNNHTIGDKNLLMYFAKQN